MIIPFSDVLTHSRLPGIFTPANSAPTSINTPEIVYRAATSAIGGNDSSAILMPKYVVPQKMQTDTNAAYAQKCG
jgi:hypothetical protein